ncbi:MAG TPA: FtsX-like permease family protein, partial [Thioalkalivibrio sp.]|nr:FtsX-like permease family protein [Thioalkalivibrio sp.]
MMLIRAFVSHYRRHPFQLAALATMIVLATMLWTGVTMLTDQARSSLLQSEETVAARVQVVRTDGQPVGVDDFATLRVAGACVAPWLEIQRRPPGGRVIGIDPLAMGCFGGSVPGSAPGEEAGTLDGAPFLDISEAAELAREGYDSQLYLLAPDDKVEVPENYALREFSLGPPTGELADSFLLNLDALSLLVLLITGLLVRSVHRLGIAQRPDSFELLRRYGLPGRRVRQLLALELIVLTTVCVSPGLWLGVQLAGMLGGGFGQALDSLFDVALYAGSADSLPWQAAGVMLMLVLAVCLLDWLVPRHWQSAASSQRGHLIAALVLVIGLVSVALAPDLAWVLVGTALVFAGAGWLTPWLLAVSAQKLSDHAGPDGNSPLTRCRRRELAGMFRHLALPVVALQFAMATVLAVQALVTTFESTFEDWLAQRLEAEFYVEVPPGTDAGPAMNRLAELKGIGPWHKVTRGEAAITAEDSVAEGETAPVDLFALTPISDLVSDWTLLASTD